ECKGLFVVLFCAFDFFLGITVTLVIVKMVLLTNQEKSFIVAICRRRNKLLFTEVTVGEFFKRFSQLVRVQIALQIAGWREVYTIPSAPVVVKPVSCLIVHHGVVHPSELVIVLCVWKFKDVFRRPVAVDARAERPAVVGIDGI